MPRKSRRQQQSICYHLFNRGINRQAIFRTEADRVIFTKLVHKYKERCGARVYHWAWMGNHYHMLIEVEFGQLRLFGGGIQQSYAQYFHRRYGTCGKFWQGRFNSQPVECAGDYMGRCGRYIERNPVVSGDVDRAWEYPWSSAAYYVIPKEDGITDANVYTGADRMTARERDVYRISLGSAEDDFLMLDEERPVIMGSAAFAAGFRKDGGRHRRKSGRKKVRN